MNSSGTMDDPKVATQMNLPLLKALASERRNSRLNAHLGQADKTKARNRNRNRMARMSRKKNRS